MWSEMGQQNRQAKKDYSYIQKNALSVLVVYINFSVSPQSVV